MSHVIDLFDSDDVLDGIWNSYVERGLRFGWKSNNGKSYDYGHWNNIILQRSKLFTFDHGRLPYISKHNNVRILWDTIKNAIGERSLLRAYVNGYTFGTDAYYHRDDEWINKDHGEDSLSETIIVYLNKHWDKDWGGETLVVNNRDEVLSAVIPKYGRIFMFDSNLLHSARPLSRTCPVLRSVIVFKTMDEKVNSPLVKFLHENILELSHSNRTLFEHLYGTGTLLERNNFSNDICKAGLYHSIYGTEYYGHSKDKQISREKVVELLGEKAEEIVYQFSTIKNRFQTITDMGNNIDREMRYALCAVEAANLIEQQVGNEYADKIKVLDDYIHTINKENEL